MKRLAIGLACITLAAASQAQMRITEFATSGTVTAGKGEFYEFTNVGSSAIDMTGWSFDDSSETAGSFDISGFGVVAAGESVVLTEVVAADFRTAWGLDSSVKVLGGNDQNLSGSGDELNIYDAGNNLIDRLTYTTQSAPTVSNNGPLSALGTNTYANWVQSSVGDSWGSYANSTGDIGNPGKYSAVPEPATMTALGLGILTLGRRRKNRSA